MGKYNKARIKKICEMIRKDTYTIGEICTAVGISESTYHQWKAKNSEFSESLKKAENDRKERLIVAANRSLMKMIQGFYVEEVQTKLVDSKKVDSNGKPISRIRVQTVTTKYIHPDVLAIIFALCNLDPENWKRNRGGEIKINVNPFHTLLAKVSYRDSSKEPMSPQEWERLSKNPYDQEEKEAHAKLLSSNLKSGG